MKQIVLADGVAYDCEWCAAMNGVLDMNLVTTASASALVLAFDNPDATEHIELRGGADTLFFDGYTRLRNLSVNAWKPGTTLIIMGKDVDNG